MVIDLNIIKLILRFGYSHNHNHHYFLYKESLNEITKTIWFNYFIFLIYQYVLLNYNISLLDFIHLIHVNA